MSTPEAPAALLDRARELLARGQHEPAERILLELAGVPGPTREAALRGLVELYMRLRRPEAAIRALEELTRMVPDSLYYFARLATMLDGIGRTEEAIGHYLRLLERQPQLADAHFNLALLYRKARRHAEAIAAYERAAELGIERVQEVYSNQGALYAELRRARQAEQMYARALQVDPSWLPALFNLAGLLEEKGDRDGALERYEQILQIDAARWQALARIAHARTWAEDGADMVARLERAAGAVAQDPAARAGLLFALGKVLDDLGRTEEAFARFRAANEIEQQQQPRYQRAQTEELFLRIERQLDADWIARNSTASAARPVFICGMFRSGTTLVEQILSGHAALTPGGELDLVPWLLSRRFMPYPERAADADRAQIELFGRDYLEGLEQRFPDADRVTDKRPDNFLHLGLLRAAFPAARFVYTRRNPLDNCLSIYFQQLSGALNYSTDLVNCAHYYGLHARLMQHWRECLGEQMFTVDYDTLVRDPGQVLPSLFEFLGLEWDQRLLDFHSAGGLAQSASLWQVRRPLHDRSTGRWQAYAPFLQELQAAFPSATGTVH